MPLQINDNSPTTFPKPDFLTLQNFKRGVITLINDSRLGKNALKEAVNLFLVEDGQPTRRPGVDWFGTSPILPVATAPSAAAAAGAGLGTGAYKYVVTFVNALGETSAGAEGTVTTTGGNQQVSLTAIPLGIGGVTARKIYRTAVGGATGTEKLVTTIANNVATTYTDSTADGSLGVAVPTGNTAIAEIDGYDYFDAEGVIHLVAIAGGNVFRSLNDALTWTLCTGATGTAGIMTNMNQNGGFLYLTNGTDDIFRYNGTTTLQLYDALVTPSAATVATTPGSPGTGYTYYYKISAVNEVGFSAASANVSVVHGTPRSSWDATTNFITLTLPAFQTNQTRFDVYLSEDDLTYYYLSSVVTPNLVYKDDGSAIVIPSTLTPTGNTTQGPKVEELTNVGVRQYGVRDTDNRSRISFTGAGTYSGAFSNAYDGGYLDWQPGGKLIPVKVADYRSGKGDPIATVWCDSADGQGGIIQLSLSTLTVGNISITVPSAYQLPGSRGTPAPGSVVNVLNDYFFYNSQAYYNLGTRAQFLNILSTDEASANIRPSVKQINRAAESGITSAYLDGNIYFSVPVGSDTNNKTTVYNTEMKAWLPEAFDIGFSKFLRYADQNKAQHLLCLKPGDTRLSEISNGINGDYGVAFNTSLLTGLYQTTTDRFEFQFVEEMEYEFSNPQGTLYVELLGIERTRGFRSIKIVPISVTGTVVGAGWDTFAWDTSPWDDTDTAPQVVSEVSAKRYTPVQRELNAIQWHVYTTSTDANYILRTLQTWGTPTQGGHPATWRANAM